METIVHTHHSRRKRNSAKINLTISIIFHALLFGVGAFWAAHEGILGKKIQELSVLLVPKEKKAEETKKAEAKTETVKKEETKPTETTTKTASAPPPRLDVPPPPPAEVVAGAPPPAVLPSFSFGGESTGAAGEGPVILYKKQVETALRLNWQRPSDVDDLAYVAEVEMSVDGNGNLVGYVWKKGSGDKRWDDSVKRALGNTRSIRGARPQGFPEKFLVRFDAEPTTEPLVAIE